MGLVFVLSGVNSQEEAAISTDGFLLSPVTAQA
jgi:hypothetical protein